MPIYEKSVRALMPEMITALAPTKDRRFSKDDALRWFAERYPKIKDGTIYAHLIRFSTNAPSRHHHNPRPEEDLIVQLPGGIFRLFDPALDPAPLRSKADAVNAPRESMELADGPETPSEFAYESDLRDFLAKNLPIIEPGLYLYKEEGITGVEFPVGGRFIDILAIDAQNRLVVIELKVSKGYDRVVGQLLRYMGWIRAHQAETGQGVRGIIAAREISEDLKLACADLPGVSLYEYELSVAIKKVELSANGTKKGVAQA